MEENKKQRTEMRASIHIKTATGISTSGLIILFHAKKFISMEPGCSRRGRRSGAGGWGRGGGKGGEGRGRGEGGEGRLH